MKSYTLPTRQLVAQQDAAINEPPRVPRSRFLCAWTRKAAYNAGYLYPFLVDEILPGDHMKYDVTAYVRMATPLFPLFDNQRIDTFFFFVPNRLVWENWQKFMGEQAQPNDSIDYTIPVVDSHLGGFDLAQLGDHMGLPTQGQIDPAERIHVNALPFRAYYLIFNEWFRDENIVAALPVAVDNGPDGEDEYYVQQRAKFHDYFTSALPWPQKFTAPTIPLLGSAPITGIGAESTGGGGGAGIAAWETSSAITGNPVAYDPPGQSKNFDPATTATKMWVRMQQPVPAGPYYPAIYADLTQATGVNINQLREAFLVQQLLERDARGGTRYIELIKSHFGVTSPDFRLQRPEYIGGGQTPLQITPIAQTAPTTGVPLGALGAAGTAAGSHHASYAATEHGHIIGLINVRTELAYQQGIPRMWSRQTRYDFYFPSTAQLGEQAILQQEIFATGVAAEDELVFGYQERWQELRTRYSEVVGIMRSNAAATIDQWHLSQNFATAPTLNKTFIDDTPPMARVLAAGEEADGQQYLADILIRRTAIRPIPTFGTPATLGRF